MNSKDSVWGGTSEDRPEPAEPRETGVGEGTGLPPSPLGSTAAVAADLSPTATAGSGSTDRRTGTVPATFGGETGRDRTERGSTGVLTDEDIAAIDAAVAALPPMSEEQVTAVCALLDANRTERERRATGPGTTPPPPRPPRPRPPPSRH